MKSVVLFCVYFVVTQSAPIRKSQVISIDELFEVAWEYHDKLTPKQEKIDSDVFEFRTSISNVLKVTSKDALMEVEENAKMILELEKPVKEAVNTLKIGDCSNNLKTLLTGITEFTGYQSSNCVKFYDNELNDRIEKAQQFISDYDGVFTEFQQIVIQAFIGKNKFSQPAEIIEQIESDYEKSSNAWETIKPKSEVFMDALNKDIGDINVELKQCMKDIQEATSSAYDFVSSRVQTCVDFDNTADLPLKALTLEDILPNYELNFV